jgi:hypothetical protein
MSRCYDTSWRRGLSSSCLPAFPGSWAAFVRVPAAILLRLRKMEIAEIAEKARTALRAKRHDLPSLRSLRSPFYSVLNHGRHGPHERRTGGENAGNSDGHPPMDMRAKGRSLAPVLLPLGVLPLISTAIHPNQRQVGSDSASAGDPRKHPAASAPPRAFRAIRPDTSPPERHQSAVPAPAWSASPNAPSPASASRGTASASTACIPPSARSAPRRSIARGTPGSRG